MNKKILIFGVLAAIMLVTISFASAVNTSTQTTKKESPLYGVRTKIAIGEKIENLKENIKARFIGERMFYIPILYRLSNNGESFSVAITLISCPFYCCPKMPIN